MSTLDIAVWNVENFAKKSDDVKNNVVEFLSSQDPDVFALFEVQSSRIFPLLAKNFDNYSYHITEGPQFQEILVGHRSSVDTFITQKSQFKSGKTYLRPGVLCTAMVENQIFPILFLHLKSSPNPEGFGIRDDMLLRALRFRSVLDRAFPDNNANYIFAGDLNTQGLDYPYTEHDIPEHEEIENLRRRTGYQDLKFLDKSKSNTWIDENDTQRKASLDHVIAADHLSFSNFDGSEVDVRGWPDVEDKTNWIRNYSDHALLYFEVKL